MVESFWTIPDIWLVRTPLSILREQASAITEQTNGVIVRIVVAHSSGSQLEIQLDLTVPALNNYRYGVLRYSQPVEMYPGALMLDSQILPVTDEDSFISRIKTTLSSQKVKTVLTSLLAQAKLL